MSNRKHRTNRVEYLYAVATGILHSGTNPALRDRLVREGYIETYREGRHRKRFTYYRLTDKAYALLARRARSLDPSLRLHRSTLPLVIWRDRYTQVPLTGQRQRKLERTRWGGDVLFA